ncbi:calumenin-B-like isoform X1 [Mercenaria mercenaria]|uniref:calumenin-B-like isoform X1 n=2 Tax=Mercenaria mercenaria TaxID=6596 RepID=UPI001E1D46A0|nr:calumenin-B-like isoform X1 [Mercenaria mercenaria]
MRRELMWSATVFLALFVLVSGGVTKASKEDVKHGAGSPKHGKQEHDVDGHHNVHFDHEAILGSYKLEKEFDDLPPEEAKQKLSLLVKKMDKNHDMFVSKEELTDWIVMSFKLLDEEEALEEFDDKDEDHDGKISWTEYLSTHFSYTEDEIKEMRKTDREDVLQFLVGVDEEQRKFEAADVNKDGYLEKDEFVAFYHPYNYEHMHNIELQRVMNDHDKNTDGFLSLEEFLGDSSHDKEWEIVEKERFIEYDTNKDNLLNFDEIRPWVLTDNREEAEDEADHLMKQADTNGDGRLTEDEIVDAHEEFVGSQATDYGRHLHFVKHKDEL